MTDTTLRAAIINSLNELGKLKFVTQNPIELNKIRDASGVLLRQLDIVLNNILNNQSDDFKNALKALNELTILAKKSKSDVDKIAQTIQKSAEAIDKIGKVLGNLTGLLL